MTKHLIVVARDDMERSQAREMGDELQRLLGINVTIITGALQVAEIEVPE